MMTGIVRFLNRLVDATQGTSKPLPEGMKAQGEGDPYLATVVVLEELAQRGVTLARIDAHSEQTDGMDMLWYAYTPRHPALKGSCYGIANPEGEEAIVLKDIDWHHLEGLLVKESILYSRVELTEFEMISAHIEISVRAAARGEDSFAGYRARHPEGEAGEPSSTQ